MCALAKQRISGDSKRPGRPVYYESIRARVGVASLNNSSKQLESEVPDTLLTLRPRAKSEIATGLIGGDQIHLE
jgi:hypothetical protein